MKFNLLEFKRVEMVFLAGVLAAILGVSYFQLKIGEMKARDVQRKADVDLVAKALQAYFEDHKTLPLAKDGQIMGCGREGAEVCPWGEGRVVDADNVVYLQRLPRDPFHEAGRRYVYEVDEKRHNFRIYTAIENGGDPGIRTGLTLECGQSVQCNWYASN